MTEVREEKNKIFVRNIPLGTKKEDIVRLFSNIGCVCDIGLPKPKPGYVTTYGFVTFMDEKDVPKAISQYNNFELCNSQGRRSVLSIVQAYQKVPHLSLKHPVSPSLWSLDSHDSDQASVGSSESSEPKTSELEQKWPKERNTVKQITNENGKKNELEKAPVGSSENSEQKTSELEQKRAKERNALLRIIDENDKKIKELEKKYVENEDELLDKKEKKLLEELERLPKKIETLKEEIEVLKLEVKLKALEKEQHQILGQ